MTSLVVSETTATEAAVIKLEGELDVSTLPLLEDRLLAVAFDSEHRCVVLDGMELTFIDSSGMRLLLSALRAVGRRGGCLTVACANPTVLRLFAVTGMDQTLVIRPTPAEALEATRSSTA